MSTENSDDAQAEARVAFMLRRSLSICLTAGQGKVLGTQEVSFDVAEGSGDGVSGIFYRPLLLIFNAYRLATSFERNVLGATERVLAARTSPGTERRVIDLQETARRRAAGEREIAFRPESAPYRDDLALAALVIEEFRGQVRATCDFVAKQPILTAAGAVKEISDRLVRWQSEMDRRLELWSKEGLPLEDARRRLAPHLDTFRQILDRSGIEDEHDPYLLYRKSTGALFEGAKQRTRALRSLARWRRSYMALRTGIGLGQDLSFIHARESHYLFEIWCFVELAALLTEMGTGDLVQRSLLRRQNSRAFSFEAGLDVYYDFLGSLEGGYSGERVLRDTHVEWFIKHPEALHKSVVIDTKYKDWRSADNLTVLGYMNDFGVDRGAVIFRGDLRREAYQISDAQSGIAIKRFGSDGEKIFCALSLRPEESFLERNRQVLTDFVHKVVLAP